MYRFNIDPYLLVMAGSGHNINQETQTVWPGMYSYCKELEKKRVNEMLDELMKYRNVISDYYNLENVDITAELAAIEGEICRKFKCALPSLLEGKYDDVKLKKRDWYEIYNEFASNEEQWELIVNDKDYEIVDQEYEDDPDWIPSRHQLQAMQQSEIGTDRILRNDGHQNVNVNQVCLHCNE